MAALSSVIASVAKPFSLPQTRRARVAAVHFPKPYFKKTEFNFVEVSHTLRSLPRLHVSSNDAHFPPRSARLLKGAATVVVGRRRRRSRGGAVLRRNDALERRRCAGRCAELRWSVGGAPEVRRTMGPVREGGAGRRRTEGWPEKTNSQKNGEDEIAEQRRNWGFLTLRRDTASVIRNRGIFYTYCLG